MTILVRPTYDPMDAGNRPGDGPLRVGGEQQGSIPSQGRDLPSTVSTAAKAQERDAQLMRDLIAGPAMVRAKGSVYLPMAPGEDPSSYRSRLDRSVFFNVTGRTLDGLVGQIFRRDPKLGSDVPELIVQHWENIDLAGTNGDVFVRSLAQDAEAVGHAAVLVEYPKTGGVQTYAEDGKTVRPYWIPIRKEDILSWRSDVVNGKQVLSQVVLREITRVADGEFGDKEQVQYRVFRRSPEGHVTVQVLGVSPDKIVSVVSDGNYPTQDEIPIAECPSSGSYGLFESVPPLLHIAYLNVAHYQQWSDYATSIHKTCVPILARYGFEDEEGVPIVVGPNTVHTTNNPQAKMEYVSHGGQALSACKQSLDDLKSDMGTLGMQMLAPQKRTAGTASAKRMDKTTEDASLAVTARGLQDCIERCLDFHAKYLGLEEGGSIQINREFDEQTMQADMLASWAGAVTAAGLPPRLLVEAMQVGGLISPDEDVDELAGEMQAAQDAKSAQAVQQAKDGLLKQGKQQMTNGEPSNMGQ